MTPPYKPIIPSWEEYGYFSGETHLQAVCRFSHNIVENNFVIED